MGFINLAEKSINAKLVYYGVGLGGKTTSLEVVHGIMCPRDEVKLVSINTEQDSTLLFDFLPIDLGQVEGFKIRVQGLTVPGQQKYVVMRKYVLQGADAVVFVVDSRRAWIEDNLQSIEDLKTNLEANGLDWKTIPLAIQYNKRDLPDLVEEERLDELFRFREVPTYMTVATEGIGVFEAFVDVVGWMVEEKVKQYGLGRGTVEPAEVGAEARAKLRQIQQTHDREAAVVRAGRGLVSVAVPDGARAAAAPAAPVVVAQQPAPLPPPGEVADDATGLLGQAITSNLELAELYSELADYKLLLEKKNRELVEVNQLISHDLKKPLTVFKTVVGLLRSGRLGELTPRQADAVGNCAESIRYMEDLISDILDASRLDYDGIVFDFGEVDMTLLVGGLVRRLRYDLEEHGVHIRVEPLPVIRGDETALQKVFMNLIGNAISYRDPGKEQAQVHVSAEDLGTDWAFRVSDNGIGIPEPSLPSVWQKFVRGENTSGISGTGLGLFIVQQLVRGHGGEVSVESVAGEGTTFRIRLPKAPQRPAHSPVA